MNRPKYEISLVALQTVAIFIILLCHNCFHGFTAKIAVHLPIWIAYLDVWLTGFLPIPDRIFSISPRAKFHSMNLLIISVLLLEPSLERIPQKSPARFLLYTWLLICFALSTLPSLRMRKIFSKSSDDKRDE